MRPGFDSILANPTEGRIRWSPPLQPQAKPSSLWLFKGEPALMHESKSCGESETAGLAAAIAYALSTAAMLAKAQQALWQTQFQ